MQFPVMEHFYTIQGEGVHTGKPAYFIRLAGCDVGCVWCDVKESWPSEGFPLYSPEEMCDWVKSTAAEMVVITGGEPAMYDCNALVDALHKEGYRVHVETSAAYPLQGQYDWVCISPKKFKQPQKIKHPTYKEFMKSLVAMQKTFCKKRKVILIS